MFSNRRKITFLPPIDQKTAEDFNKKHRVKILAWAGVMIFGVLFWFFLCMFYLYIKS